MNEPTLAPMWRALALAQQARQITPPNPSVGCVLIGPGGQVVGEGHTQQTGGPHAEVMAIRSANGNTRGATAYVTLEPCAHFGRTPPCCDALVQAGVREVIVAIGDPNPKVAGQGLARLQVAGIKTTVLPRSAPVAMASRELNIGFFSRMIRKTPWVRLKVAASLDGHTALDDGRSQWITGPEARTDGHAWRLRAGALLTGIGTVLQDNPRLDVRLPDVPRQPALAVVDSRLQTPPEAQIFQSKRPVWIYTASTDSAREAELQACGATVIPLPGPNGKVDLAAMLRDLAQREVNELHVEAGFKLNGSLVREGLVDEFLVYLAPKLLGQGLGMANFGPLASLDQAVPLHFLSAEPVGPDLRIVARIPGRDKF